MEENKDVIELNTEDIEKNVEAAEKKIEEAEAAEEKSEESTEEKTGQKTGSDEASDKEAEKDSEKPAEKKTSEKSPMKKPGKKTMIIAAAALAVIAIVVGVILITKGGSKKKKDAGETTYYTYADIQKDVAYLAKDKDQLDRLNRLIDPMKKSNKVDANYVNSVAEILGIKKDVYKSIIKGYSGDDIVPQEVFDDFYYAVIDSGNVEGIEVVDIFVHSMNGPDVNNANDDNAGKLMVINTIGDGITTFEVDNVRLSSLHKDKIVSFYSKDGTIFRTIGLSEKEHTITNVLLAGVDKEAGTASFLYDNDIVTLADPDSKTAKELVVDITFTNDGISSITPSGEEIIGRITAVNATNLKIHDVGFYYYDEAYKVYDNSGEVPKEALSSQFLVGYKNLKIYVENRRVKAVVILDSQLDSEEIRVLINDSEYTGYKLKDVTFSCNSDYAISFSNGSTEQKTADTKVMFTPASFGMHESVTISSEDPNARFTIESIERNGINPVYRGTFEVVMMGDFLYIINKLPIEEYLYAVVSSELADSYGEETAKAFAVVARGYACKMMESNQFSSYGADIDDSNSTLLYNYYPETERSIRIVNETYGLVPAYEDKIIMPYHFLTSCGITCANDDIYSEEAQPYYGSNYESIEKEKVLLSSERSFKYYIDKGNDYSILEVDEPYYRWSIDYTTDEMSDVIASGIDERIKNTVDTILVLEKPAEDADGKDGDKKDDKADDKADDAQTAADQTSNDDKYKDIIENGNFVPAEEGIKLGKIEDIIVIERSDAGVVKELLIIGTENTIRVKGQTNIRYIFNPAKQTIVKNDGTEVTGYSLMPSPFYYVEKTETGFVIKGGGFGNGVGLSLSGAEILDQMGYNYTEIIGHYYDGVQLRNMFGLYDKDAKDNPDEKPEDSTEATTEK
ncbi:MAG: SpoIID/LytB domain-containing protein [Eubacterium sp.]|nr:SpoIID/LytB domain-containing protein [Eubacterium sp.]